MAGVWFLEFAAWQFLTTYVTLGWLLKGSPPDNRATTVREPQGGWEDQVAYFIETLVHICIISILIMYPNNTYWFCALDKLRNLSELQFPET